MPNWTPTAESVGTYANDVPMITGRPEPKRPPNSGCACTSVTRPDITRDTWMSRVFWSAGRWHRFATMIAGVMMPTTAATTCCSAMGTSSCAETKQCG